MNKFYIIVLMSLAFIGGVAGGLLYQSVVSLPQPETPQINIEIPGEPLRHVQVEPTLEPVPFLEQVQPFVVEFRQGHWVPSNEPIATAEPIPVIEAADRLPPPTVPTFVKPKVPMAKPSRRTLLDRLLD